MALALTLVCCTGTMVQPSSQTDRGSGSSNASAQFVYPSPGATIDPFQHFSWTTVNNASGYYLQIGTSPGGSDVFGVGDLPPNVTSWAVDNLLPGVTYYARLETILPGFPYVDISFKAANQALPTDPATFYATIEQLTSSVRLSAGMFSNVPTPGTPLANEVALRGRTMADCTDYSYALIDLLQQKHIYARRVVLSLAGNFWIAHTLVEYYDPFRSKWSVADPSFGVMYFDDNTQTGQSAAELNDYVFSESWSSIKPKFVTPNVDQYLRNYYVDPVILFLNIVPEGSTPENSTVHDPLQFMIPALVWVQGFYVFEFSDSSGAMQIGNPPGPYTSGTIPVQAEDGTRWSRVVPLNDGWTITSGSTNVQVFTPRRVLF